ncbi:lipopolysaccharide biosynthesis protein [Hoeflea prorocentri]|uniref:Membrane protein involved in the export of O-antigen and teichoic acid n=1 Tax=Hoeflea prorocentri TaxID=1922333 RepID=A0A9X3ZGZ9_9HYPH|nr:hypothetical protein [Hoeflea prorocentri]MCY6380428.1 hypothetical protein [Hoeflea prorocentri]MDA5398228.1 hypothetical protein [Hoeflea prorocentri]
MKHGAFRSFLARFSILVSGRLVGAVATFALNLLIIRLLGVDALADYAVFVSISGVLAVCLFLGFNSVASFFAAEYQNDKSLDLLKGFAIRAMKNGLAVIAVLLAAFSVYWAINPVGIGLDHVAYLGIVVVTAAGLATLNLNSAIQVGLKRPLAGLLPDTLLRPVILIAGAALLLFGQWVTDISGIIALAGVAAWLAVAAVLIWDANFRRRFREFDGRGESGRWYRAAFPWLGTSLLWDHMIDLVVLTASLLAGSVEIAILHICFRYRVLAGFGMRTIHSLMMPEITEQTLRRDTEALQRKLFLTNIASIGYSICVLAVFAVVGHFLLGLFSKEVEAGYPILLAVTLTMLARSIFGPAPLILAVHNQHVATMLVSLAGLVVAVTWMMLAYPGLGIMAAASGYTAGNLLVSVVLWRYARLKTGIDCSIFAALTPAGATFAVK